MADDIERAVRAGCTAADVHLKCSYPDCACKQIPAAIRAALGTEPQPTEAQLQRVDAVLVAFTGATLTRDDVWRLKHRVRKALGVAQCANTGETDGE